MLGFIVLAYKVLLRGILKIDEYLLKMEVNESHGQLFGKKFGNTPKINALPNILQKLVDLIHFAHDKFILVKILNGDWLYGNFKYGKDVLCRPLDQTLWTTLQLPITLILDK